MKKSEFFRGQIHYIRESIIESVLEILKELGGKVNLGYYVTEHYLDRYGSIENDNNGYPVFAEFHFVELDGDNDFVVSASDWDDTCSFKIKKNDFMGTYVLGLLQMLEEIKEIADEEGKVVDSYDYD